MKPYFILLAAALTLAACGGNPFLADPEVPVDPPVDPEVPVDTPDPGTGVIVPASVKKNMQSASLSTYAPGDATINVQMSAQDAAALRATYQRNAAFDVGGYQAYTYQETTSNRYVVALVATAGDARGLIAVEAGQFANYHGGGIFSRADVFTVPVGDVGAQNKFNYSGTYAGLLNFGQNPGSGPGGDLDPVRSYRTTGRMLVTADFNEMTVSGGVDQRRIVDTNTALATQFLFESNLIDSAGNFNGRTQRLDVDPDTLQGTLSDSGSYAGTFSGTDASEIAMLLVFQPISDSAEAMEHGLFVSSNCELVGGPACP
ncbi:hypothetical protein GCM10010873_18820 [Cypionkella aquatica]|uniref:Thymidylate synthase n=1 Tax=Cypionkella aquatica TaxID=1756042 RepID=A0AA37TSZ7_9RHOB|nr:hypothetical protein [Cypionkella aquatica]GLS86908.1 hypothetical protein GCM10010873_18820 [Cypionkella aquatica]